MKKLGLGLIAGSFGLWGLVAIVPWLPISTAQKTIAAATLVILAEILWWIGVVLVGKEVAQRYRHRLNPIRLWQRWKTLHRR
jgi:hypothetical protein